MTIFIDRRLSASGKNLVNRQRFLRRSRRSIRSKMEKVIEKSNIQDINSGETLIPVDLSDIREYQFVARDNPQQHFVLVGNEKYVEGDKIYKPLNQSDGRGAGQGDLTDEFQFVLTKEEFLDFFFEDLELPNLIKTQIQKTQATKFERAGISTSGNQSNINLERTFRQSLGRRLALKRPSNKEVAQARETIALLEPREAELDAAELEMLTQARNIVRKSKRIPFLDERDLRYNRWEAKPKPTTDAVMFCLMDVSGSMGVHQKEIAKRFFLLLYMFLKKAYKDINIVFVRHTELGEEVDEKTFFYDTKSGGTVVSSGLHTVIDIINQKYSPQDFNIYVAQASDGDNAIADNPKCVELLTKVLLPITQYFAYIETKTPNNDGDLPFYSVSSTLWPVYAPLESSHKNFVCRQVHERNEIWPVFRDLFQK